MIPFCLLLKLMLKEGLNSENLYPHMGSADSPGAISVIGESQLQIPYLFEANLQVANWELRFWEEWAEEWAEDWAKVGHDSILD